MSKEKSVGILTLYNPINYGACLQTYALRKYLEEIGYNAVVIDYRSESGEDTRTMLQKLRSIIWSKTIKTFFADKTRLQRTLDFKKKYIDYSDMIYTSAETLKNVNNYTTLVVGSDQVWNPRYAGLDPSWFLQFGNAKKRISYAASFGLPDVPAKYENVYAEYLNKLDKISVREETGQQIVSKLIGKNVPVVIDPVFLLSQQHWAQFAQEPQQQEYVLCYYMQGFPRMEAEIKRAAETYAKKHDLKVINIGKRDFAKIYLWENNQFGVGPCEFLGLIKNADAIITNSFHGTAFSVLFEKKILAVVDSGIVKTNLSSRLVDLLQRLHLSQCLDDAALPSEAQPQAITNESKELLKHEILAGKDFLNKALEGV